MHFISGALSGTQEVRRRMGRYGFSARVVFGNGLFFTISPSERHGCLAIRLVRYRAGDPILNSDSALDERRWIGVDVPSLEARGCDEDEECTMLMPGYDWWRCNTKVLQLLGLF